MSDEPVVVIDSENPVDFDITTDSVDFNFDEVNPFDSDLGSSVLVQNTDHAILSNRDISDQHPISAITGLNDALSGINYDIARAELDIDSLERRKQDNLVSGTNIKTINGESILGPGDIETLNASISGGNERLTLWYGQTV